MGKEIDIGPAKQRAILAIIALNASGRTSQATLVDRLWDHEPPARARQLIYNYVTGLRARLREVPGVHLSNDGGYQITMDPDTIDVHRFRRLISEARCKGAANETAEQLRLLRSALRLWRAEPLSGLDTAWLAGIRRSLELQRLTGAVELFELELRTGNATGIIEEISLLHNEYPTSEPLAGLLIRALNQSGLHADALKVFRDTRRVLTDLYGIEPGQHLQQLHLSILAGTRP